ncbi:MAG: DUF6044 family protein [Roseburia sp.]|nr:DUF6044 family protein [Roseburia sp.]
MDFYRRHKNTVLLIWGCLLVSLMVFPCLILGEGSYVEIHDQLDGEVLNYIYRAKYLFRGTVIPEFMNGMSKAAMALPAPFGVIFYVLLPPYPAYLAMWWMALLAGFAGMYRLCCYLRIKEEIAFLSALLFAYMPFYPVYGLAAWGQPLLVLCFLRLIKGERKAEALLGIVFYAGFSSLSLVGFVWVLLGFLVGCYLMLYRKDRAGGMRALTGWGALLTVYVLTNLDLLESMLGGGFETHRQEMKLLPTENLLAKGVELLFAGGAYSRVYSGAVLLVAVFLISYQLTAKKEQSLYRFEAGRRMLRLLGGLLAAVLTGILLAVVWNGEAVVALRKKIGGMPAYFQADRIYWVFPFLWMLLFACVAQLLWLLRGHFKSRFLKGGVALIGMMLFLAEGGQILRDNTLNKNIRLLLFRNYEQVTWESIYMEEVFDEIDKVIGDDKARVSVVSLGIYPSVALYNGYTCADGYSNNYSLDYKHAFRRIMAQELEENPQVKAYFDDWGNRCYLVCAELGFHAMVGKGQGEVYEDLKLDTTAMRELNIGYVLAAAPIADSDKLGLSLIDGSPFSSESSYYEVWVYHMAARP